MLLWDMFAQNHCLKQQIGGAIFVHVCLSHLEELFLSNYYFCSTHQPSGVVGQMLL